MKIRVRLGIAAAVGLLVAGGSSFQARAQVGIVTPNPYGADGAYNTFNPGGLQQIRLPKHRASGRAAPPLRAPPQYLPL